MLRRVQQYIRTYNLLQPHSRVLVCLSGGADSVALLDVLCRGGYKCVAAHCNFHLRGAESERDEMFVRKFCQERQLELYVQDFDTKSAASLGHQSVEMAARQLRYRWFDEIAISTGCTAVAVAHHQNDQAETVLLNLLRGSGIRGLAAMRPKSRNPEVESQIPIIRPLLCTTHEYIVHYLSHIRHLPWVEDSTNGDTAIRRNAIRDILRQCSKGEIENICNTATYMQGYADRLDGQASRQQQIVELYEELKELHPKDIEPLYDAIQQGVSGKIFCNGKVVTHKHGYRLV